MVENEELMKEELEKRVKKFLKCFEDAREELSEENIHDLRISIQRLRASCYLAAGMSNPKGLKRIMKASGEVRDCHIALSIIDEFGGVPGLEGLLTLKLQNNMENLRVVLAKTDVESIVERVRGLRIRETSNFDIMRIIADLFLEFKSFEGSYAEGDPAVLHKMRIALKKLRYTLEALKYSFIDDELLKSMHELQQLLGEIHDIDLFIERFGAHRDLLSERRRALISELQFDRVNAIEPFMKVSILSQKFQSAPEDAMEYAEYSSHGFGCYAILKEYQVKDEDILKAAILKDSGAPTSELKEIFGERVAWLVSEIKRREGESDEDFFKRLREGGSDLMLLKLAEAKEKGEDIEKLMDENL
jgi:CHAD domain-containing protein